MRSRLVLAVLPVTLIAVAAAPSFAAPKTTKGTYTAAGVPDPSANATGVCMTNIPGAQQYDELKLPAAGRLKVDMTGFQGDWDLCLYNDKGELLSSSAGFVEATTETVSFKAKKPMTVTIGAANVGGTPAATVSWEFTTAK